MNPVFRTAATAAMSFCLPGLLLSQRPAALPVDATALRFPTDRALIDVDDAGTVWAAGECWKASFAADGMTFVPFLGSDLPSQPVTFRLVQASIGGDAACIERAKPRLGPRRVDYSHGVCVESYLLTATGIEQTFRFDALPRRGELVLDIAVETGLVFERDGDGVAFTRTEGGIRYGQATAIDGDGNRLALVTEWTGSALRIVVPAAFVADAALPLLIDPLIGTKTTLTPSTPTLSDADMAYDDSLGQYFACYERAYSATDHDIYVAFFGSAMQFQSLLAIDLTSAYWSKPRIAGLEGPDVGCVVAETSTGNVSPFSIQARRFAAGASPTASPVAMIASGTPYDRHDPDIGGDSSPAANSRFLVAWEATAAAVNNTEVRTAIFDAAGAFSSGPMISGGIGLKHRPHVSKTCGAPGGGTEGWAIVYRFEPYQQNTGELQVSFIDRTGALRWPGNYAFVTLTAPTPNFGSDWDVSDPADHANGRWFLCSERRYDTGSGSASMTAVVFDRNGNAPFGSQTVVAGSRDRQRPTAACDGLRFALSYDEIYSATDKDIRVHTLHNTQGQLVQDELCYATTSLEVERGNALCAAHGRPNEYGLCWLHDAGGQCTLEAQVYRGVASGGFGSRGTGCGGLTIAATGQPALGESVTFTLPNATGFTGFVAGTPVSWAIAACPGCQQGASGATLFGPALPLAIPSNTAFLGVTLAVQGFQFLPSSQPCLGQVALSNTLDMRIQ